MALLVTISVDQMDEDVCQSVDDVLPALRKKFGTDVAQTSWQCFSNAQVRKAPGNPIILLFSASPAEMSSELDSFYRLLVNKCAEERKRLVHVVKNFRTPEPSKQVAWQMSRRAERIFRFHDLQNASISELISDIERDMANDSFSSPGESFAWQLVVGFLSYILPSFHSCVRSTLLDEQSVIRAEVLRDYELTDVHPKQVLVLPKYFLMLDERIVHDEVSVAMTPQEVFPGCRKISKASLDLCLEFDSPVYKKRIPSYMLTLEKPITTDQSTFTHVVTFCCFAAPMYVMQKLDMTHDEKSDMFQQFRKELQHILSHPKSSEMLRAFSDFTSSEATGHESSCVQLIDVNDLRSIESAILQEAEAHLLGQSLLPQTPAQSAAESIFDDFPLMSMAFAMAANCWIGFSQILMSHIRDTRSQGEQLQLDLPYCFVIPKSSRYPDEAKLLRRFEELGVSQQLHQFQASNARRYTFRTHSWRSLKIAFEIPPSVLGIRKQAECGFGGVRTEDLSAHLAEFRDSLARFVSGSDGCFRVIEWDDVTDFVDDAWAEPTSDFALSLLRCLETNLAELQP